MKTRIYRLTTAEYRQEIGLAKTDAELRALITEVQIRDEEVVLRRTESIEAEQRRAGCGELT